MGLQELEEEAAADVDGEIGATAEIAKYNARMISRSQNTAGFQS